MENLNILFEANPDQKIIHQTSDGYNFWQEHYADAHASSLKDKTVTKFTRSDVAKAIKAAKKAADANAIDEQADDLELGKKILEKLKKLKDKKLEPAQEPAQEPQTQTENETPNTEEK